MPEPTPDGRTGRVAAGCVFWMHATERTFTTAPADHANCSVGSYTHGLLSLEEAATKTDVGDLVEFGLGERRGVSIHPGGHQRVLRPSPTVRSRRRPSIRASSSCASTRRG